MPVLPDLLSLHFVDCLLCFSRRRRLSICVTIFLSLQTILLFSVRLSLLVLFVFDHKWYLLCQTDLYFADLMDWYNEFDIFDVL